MDLGVEARIELGAGILRLLAHDETIAEHIRPARVGVEYKLFHVEPLVAFRDDDVAALGVNLTHWRPRQSVIGPAELV